MLRIFTLGVTVAGVLFVILPLLSMGSYTTVPELLSTLVSPAVDLSIYLTMLAGGIASLVCVALGAPAGYYLARTGGLFSTKVLGSVLELPIMIPHFVVGIALLLFAPFLFQTLTGVIAVMVFVGLSYTVKAAESSFAELGEGYEKVAQTLGAGPMRAFFTVVLPMSARSIAGGALLSWARGISEMGAFLVLAYFVYPLAPLVPAATNPMSIYAYQVYQLYGVRGAASVSVVYVLVSMAVFLGAKYAHRWRELFV